MNLYTNRNFKDLKTWKNLKDPNLIKIGPDDFSLETTTVWDFPKRGDWASHTHHYRGNWSPYVVRNILELYSKEGDTVLDPMVGGGTTAVECLLTNRNSICSDINPNSIRITKDRMNLPNEIMNSIEKTNHMILVADARNLGYIKDEQIDLIATHPPYAGIIRYSDNIYGDLSTLSSIDDFFIQFRQIIKELYRVLKPSGHCAVLMGDTHKLGHYVPLSTKLLLDFLQEGFILKEDVIKIQNNCYSDRFMEKRKSNILLTMHEHLFIFEKPLNGNNRDYRYSTDSLMWI